MPLAVWDDGVNPAGVQQQAEEDIAATAAAVAKKKNAAEEGATEGTAAVEREGIAQRASNISGDNRDDVAAMYLMLAPEGWEGKVKRTVLDVVMQQDLEHNILPEGYEMSALKTLVNRLKNDQRH